MCSRAAACALLACNMRCSALYCKLLSSLPGALTGVRGLMMQVVHIDLGIAFEQGRFLNTPELVPFRLTRDIVDGMGAAGAQPRAL